MASELFIALMAVEWFFSSVESCFAHSSVELILTVYCTDGSGNCFVSSGM